MNIKRFLVVSAAVVGVLFLSCIVVLGAAIAWSGVATVRIEDPEDGFSLYLPVPMAAVEAAVASMRWGESGHLRMKLDTHLRELGEFGPLVGALLLDLENSPDVTLVEVESHESVVAISKRGGSLLIDVDDRGSGVHVSLPIRSVRRTLDTIASLD